MTVSVPSIASAAVLIDLSIGSWTGRKLDRKASDAVTLSNNAAVGVARVNKKLLGDCAELDAVQKFAANARNTHYAMTMPWSDLGLRLCPTAQYVGKYEKVMSELQTEFWRLVKVFLEAYEWEIQSAQLKLGDLFNADEYPTTEALASKFKFRYAPLPIADAGDWRLDIGNEAAAVMKADYEGYYKVQLTEAMGDVWKRAHVALTKMSDRLDYADHETKKVFRDSLVDNVQEIIELLGVCNMTNDPVMTRAQQQLSTAMVGITPEALREDAYLRQETKSRVDAVKSIIDSLPGMGW